MLEMDYSGITVEGEPDNMLLFFVDEWQMAEEEQSDRMASDMEVCGKKGLLYHWWKCIANDSDCVEK